MSITRRRSLSLERDLTEHAARGYVDPGLLIQHAETRAGGPLSREYVRDPMLIQVGLDRLREVREELADGRNHLVWWLQEHPDDETSPRKLRALTYLALAYSELLDD